MFDNYTVKGLLEIIKAVDSEYVHRNRETLERDILKLIDSGTLIKEGSTLLLKKRKSNLTIYIIFITFIAVTIPAIYSSLEKHVSGYLGTKHEIELLDSLTSKGSVILVLDEHQTFDTNLKYSEILKESIDQVVNELKLPIYSIIKSNFDVLKNIDDDLLNSYPILVLNGSANSNTCKSEATFCTKISGKNDETKIIDQLLTSYYSKIKMAEGHDLVINDRLRVFLLAVSLFYSSTEIINSECNFLSQILNHPKELSPLWTPVLLSINCDKFLGNEIQKFREHINVVRDSLRTIKSDDLDFSSAKMHYDYAYHSMRFGLDSLSLEEILEEYIQQIDEYRMEDQNLDVNFYALAASLNHIPRESKVKDLNRVKVALNSMINHIVKGGKISIIDETHFSFTISASNLNSFHVINEINYSMLSTIFPILYNLGYGDFLVQELIKPNIRNDIRLSSKEIRGLFLELCFLNKSYNSALKILNYECDRCLKDSSICSQESLKVFFVIYLVLDEFSRAKSLIQLLNLEDLIINCKVNNSDLKKILSNQIDNLDSFLRALDTKNPNMKSRKISIYGCQELDCKLTPLQTFSNYQKHKKHILSIWFPDINNIKEFGGDCDIYQDFVYSPKMHLCEYCQKSLMTIGNKTFAY